MSPACDVRGLVVFLNGEKTLGPLDLAVESGEFLVVVGPNGSGKTTLLRALSGHVRDCRGTIRLFGRNLARLSSQARARTISHLPQFPAADIPFDVEMTVRLGRAPRQGALGLEREGDAEAVENALRMTGTTHLRRRPLHNLSGGELKRVLLARALCREPKILLLDEPTASLDPGAGMMIMDMLEDVRSTRGTTIIMVSHDLNAASAYGDRLLLLKKGAAEVVGAPENVLTPARLSAAYGWETAVDADPFTGAPRMTVAPGPMLRRKSRARRTNKSAGREEKSS